MGSNRKGTGYKLVADAGRTRHARRSATPMRVKRPNNSNRLH